MHFKSEPNEKLKNKSSLKTGPEPTRGSSAPPKITFRANGASTAPSLLLSGIFDAALESISAC